MQETLKGQQGIKQPWFIRDFRGNKIMLFRDFEQITGVKLFGNYTGCKLLGSLVGGYDYNGWGWKDDQKRFMEEYGFDFGEEPCMFYLYERGIAKAVRLVEKYEKKKLSVNAKQEILNGLEQIEPPKKQKETKRICDTVKKQVSPIQICITVNENGIALR